MVVPWTGFAFAKLVRQSQPRNEARYVRFTSVLRPDELRDRKRRRVRVPYYEGIRIDEALNELAFFTVGSTGIRCRSRTALRGGSCCPGSMATRDRRPSSGSSS